jgi:hypothetical protein
MTPDKSAIQNILKDSRKSVCDSTWFFFTYAALLLGGAAFLIGIAASDLLAKDYCEAFPYGVFSVFLLDKFSKAAGTWRAGLGDNSYEKEADFLVRFLAAPKEEKDASEDDTGDSIVLSIKKPTVIFKNTPSVFSFSQYESFSFTQAELESVDRLIW